MNWRHLVADTRPLSNAHFRRLWTANIITVIGAQLTVVAVPAQLYAETGSSAYVGLSGLFGLVPLVVFGLWGGALADHVDRRKLLIVSTLGIIATSIVYWAQAAVGATSPWLLLSLFSLQQAFFAVNQPLRNAILPTLLPVRLLPAANSLNMTVLMAGGIAGPLIGGAMIPVLGYSWLYLIDSITLCATLAAVWRLPPLPVTRDDADVANADARQRGTPGLRSVIDGFVYLRGHPVLLMSFVVDIIAMVFGMPRALFPELAQVSFGGPPAGGFAFSVLYAAIPLGAVLGGVFSGWVSRVRRHGRAVIFCIALWGAGIVGFGLFASLADGGTHPWLLPAAAMLVAAGAADMSSAAFRQSILQGAAADEVRGRLQGVFIVVVVGGPRIADVLHGGVSPLIGAAPTTIAGGMLVLVLLGAVALAVPAFARYDAWAGRA
ncbi:MAG: MFS transporter, partial [Dermatophilaceae bacterium]